MEQPMIATPPQLPLLGTTAGFRRFSVPEYHKLTAAPGYAKTTIYHVSDFIPLVLDGTTVTTFAVGVLLP
jgi:hypothetical protein